MTRKTVNALSRNKSVSYTALLAITAFFLNCDLYKEAIDVYEAPLKTIASSVGVVDKGNLAAENFAHGRECFDNKAYAQAIAYLTQAVRLNPNNDTAYNYLGQAHFRKGNNAEAVANYDRVIALTPNYTEAYTNRARAHAKANDYERAIADYEQAIRLNPNDAWAYNYRGLAHAGMQDTNRAIADLKIAYRLAPNDTTIMRNYGKIRKQPISIYESGEETGIATQYYKNRDYQRAGVHFQRAIWHNPNSATAYNGLGLVFFQLRRYDDAIANFEEAVQISPNHANYTRNLEEARQRRNNNTAANSPAVTGEKSSGGINSPTGGVQAATGYATVKIGNRVWMAENLRIETGNSWCPAGDARNCQSGRLYDWNTAIRACPEGWRLPTRDDWNAAVQGGAAFKNQTGGGLRTGDGAFINAGKYNYWWSSTESGSGTAYYRYIGSDVNNLTELQGRKNSGLSVRCVQR